MPYSGGYPITTPDCVGPTRVGNPGTFWSYSGRYPGAPKHIRSTVRYLVIL